MDRSERWLSWMEGVRAAHLRMSAQPLPSPEARRFFAHHYAMHTPLHFTVGWMPAMAWTPESLRQRASDIQVQVQAGRLETPDYEVRSHSLKTTMGWHQFMDRMEFDHENAVYLTANNAASNTDLNALLLPDIQPLPSMLTPDPFAGFLWIGRGTLTPTHHDLTNNLLVQLVGDRMVRLIPPSQQPKLRNTRWVFSDYRWVDEDTAAREGISYTDIMLHSGQALFIPVGWWHCVRTFDVSIMASFTNFWWPNHWTAGFPE